MSWIKRARFFRRTSRQSPTTPGTPTSSNQAGTSVTIGWAAVAGAVRYRIDHQQVDGRWREVSVQTGTSFVHLRTHRIPVRVATNNYRVRAESAKGHLSAPLAISIAHT